MDNFKLRIPIHWQGHIFENASVLSSHPFVITISRIIPLTNEIAIINVAGLTKQILGDRNPYWFGGVVHPIPVPTFEVSEKVGLEVQHSLASPRLFASPTPVEIEAELNIVAVLPEKEGLETLQA